MLNTPLLLLAALPPLGQTPPALQVYNLPPVPVPAENPYSDDKALLGKALFWDEQLSSTRTVACGTCHIPGAGGEDPRSLLATSVNPGPDGAFGTADDVFGSPGVPRTGADGSYLSTPHYGIGVQVTGRQAPSMINAVYSPELFWDGRAPETFRDPVTGNVVSQEDAALESQAAGPPGSDVEMAHLGRDWLDIAARVEVSHPLALASNVPANLAAFVGANDYPELFEQVFGTTAVTPVRIIQAIATYERTLLSDRAPFDDFVLGLPSMTPEEVNGMWLFFNHCETCHPAPLFTDNLYHNIGVQPIAEDIGRQAVTGDPLDAGKVRTPGVRNMALRGPFFSDGGAATIVDVIEFYDRGGDHHVNQSVHVQPLGLTDTEKAELVAFVTHGLLDSRVQSEAPPFDRPALYTESANVPTSYGQGTPGLGGLTPRALALEPALHGSDSITLAVDSCRPGAAGFLVVDRFQGSSIVAGAELLLARSAAMRIVPVVFDPLGGFSSHSLGLPDDPAIIGAEFHAQWIVRDPAAGGGLAASQGVSFRIL